MVTSVIADQEKQQKKLKIRQRFKDDLPFYAENCLQIKTKEGGLTNFTFNKAQQYIHERLQAQLEKTGRVRALILKGRQQGASTYIGGRFFHQTTHRRGCSTFILTHHSKATDTLYGMVHRYNDNLPESLKPTTGRSNSRELIFDKLDSGYGIGTAGTKEVGRGGNVQLFHGSEVAFWDNASNHAKGVLQSVGDVKGTEVILESTANGVGNFFHQQWVSAEQGNSDFQAIFVPWYWQEEYVADIPTYEEHYGKFKRTPEEGDLAEQFGLTDEQLAWRRKKVAAFSTNGADGAEAFKQEYPMVASEAFLASGDNGLIKPKDVVKARKCSIKDQAFGPLVVGVDPARFGNDATAIIRRQGRKAYNLEHFKKLDTMEVTGICARIIRNEKPHRMFIDVGGLGAGVVDRLNELGFRDIVQAVNFGSRPTEPIKYVNRRAEMWGNMNLWLKEFPCEIPDNDSLQSDLVAVNYSWDSNGRMKLESKEDMRKRGVQSPDGGDALGLTFAMPVSFDLSEFDEYINDRDTYHSPSNDGRSRYCGY